jgi:hypothetical protein
MGVEPVLRKLAKDDHGLEEETHSEEVTRDDGDDAGQEGAESAGPDSEPN